MKVITTNLLNRFWKNGVLPIKTALAGKLDTAKVINNLLTTAAGYALDARQGKILNDKITELNSNMTNLLLIKSKSNRINVTAGQSTSSYIILDVVPGYTPVISTVYSSHITTKVTDARITDDRVVFYFDATAPNTPETFTADTVYVKTAVM